MKEFDELREEIEKYISLKKLNPEKYKVLHVVYYPSLEMTPDTANRLELYFENKGYINMFRKCNSCVNKYDVEISW